MRVGVLTMLRDRLDYTKHCYATLVENAGCDFDWFVVDQGSTDGTVEWLNGQDVEVTYLTSNIGICPALNMMLDEMVDADEYDVLVRWDNDCEVLTPNTLKDVAYAAAETGWILSPQVNGLLNPLPQAAPRQLGFHAVRETTHLGGIFMAVPADLFDSYRYNEAFPPYAGDEDICRWYRELGGHCGYVQGYEVNHYERVVQQENVLPEYQARKLAEMGAL